MLEGHNGRGGDIERMQTIRGASAPEIIPANGSRTDEAPRLLAGGQ